MTSKVHSSIFPKQTPGVNRDVTEMATALAASGAPVQAAGWLDFIKRVAGGVINSLP